MLNGEPAVAVARRNGIKPTAFHQRLCYGWSVERAATEPTRARGGLKYMLGDEPATSVAERNGISASAFYVRLKLGWSVERAATELIGSHRRYSLGGRSAVTVAMEAGLSKGGFYERVWRGVPVARAVSREHMTLRLTEDGRGFSEVAREHGMIPAVVADRVRRGVPLERALQREPVLCRKCWASDHGTRRHDVRDLVERLRREKPNVSRQRIQQLVAAAVAGETRYDDFDAPLRDFLRGLRRDSLAPRIASAFRYLGIKTIQELIGVSPVRLLRIKNFGRRSMKLVRQFVEQELDR